MGIRTTRRDRAHDRWDRAHSFSSANLGYRPGRAGDAEPGLATIDAEVRRWQGWEDDISASGVRRQLVAQRNLAHCAVELLVCDPAGAVVGRYSFRSVGTAGEVELGWWLGPSGRGRGWGVESLVAMLGYGHRHLGAERLRMGTSSDNVRALRQIAAVGAELVDERPHTLPNGATIDGCWFVHVDPGARGGAPPSDLGWLPPCRTGGS